MKFVAAKCPSCGGDLQVPEDRVTVTCLYCSGQVVVRDAIQAASGVNLANLLKLAKAALEADNYQEAYDYYTKVLELDSGHYEAWLGKGEAAGWLSTTDKMRLPEVLSAMQNAIEHSPQEEKTAVQIWAANRAHAILVACWNMWRKHLVSQPWADDGIWLMFLNGFPAILDTLDQAHAWSPREKVIIESTINICECMVSGVPYKQWGQYGPWEATGTVSKEYKKVLSSKVARLVAEMQTIDPAYKPPKLGGCFVVTATMGDLNHPTVVLLRQFRDKWLLEKRSGRAFVGFYYAVGPCIARVIDRSALLRRLTVLTVIFPSISVAHFLLRRQRRKTASERIAHPVNVHLP